MRHGDLRVGEFYAFRKGVRGPVAKVAMVMIDPPRRRQGWHQVRGMEPRHEGKEWRASSRSLLRVWNDQDEAALLHLQQQSNLRALEGAVKTARRQEHRDAVLNDLQILDIVALPNAAQITPRWLDGEVIGYAIQINDAEQLITLLRELLALRSKTRTLQYR